MSLCNGVDKKKKNERHFVIEDYHGCYEDFYTGMIICNIRLDFVMQ